VSAGWTTWPSVTFRSITVPLTLETICASELMVLVSASRSIALSGMPRTFNWSRVALASASARASFACRALQLRTPDHVDFVQLPRARGGALGELALRERLEISELRRGKIGAVDRGEHLAAADVLSHRRREIGDAPGDRAPDTRHAGLVGFDAPRHMQRLAYFRFRPLRRARCGR